MTLGATVAGRSVIVRVPATSANLGPGFDTLGLALAVYDELIVTASATPGVLVDVNGVGDGDVPTDESNLVARAIAYTFEHVGQPVPGLHLVANNVIPHGGGLGSSAAAIVSGVMAAKGLLDGIVEIDDERMLVIATELEGHPDNVAPALLGGLTIAWTAESGPLARKLDVHHGVLPPVFVPDHSVSTALARSLQPALVPFEDAVFNVSRAALLIAALTQSPELLMEATEDRLHQEYRASAMPETNSLMHLLREHGFAAVVSGAGPSILVLANEPTQREAAARSSPNTPSTPGTALTTAVDVEGATVKSHQVEVKPQQ